MTIPAWGKLWHCTPLESLPPLTATAVDHRPSLVGLAARASPGALPQAPFIRLAAYPLSCPSSSAVAACRALPAMLTAAATGLHVITSCCGHAPLTAFSTRPPSGRHACCTRGHHWPALLTCFDRAPVSSPPTRLPCHRLAGALSSHSAPSLCHLLRGPAVLLSLPCLPRGCESPCVCRHGSAAAIRLAAPCAPCCPINPQQRPPLHRPSGPCPSLPGP
jgi:hypothetical protein